MTRKADDGVNVMLVTSRGRGRSAQHHSYAAAAKSLLRDMILDSMHDLLLTRDWSSITLAEVAQAGGTSRQAIYKEFGSRQGLAQAYALRLADRFVDAVGDALDANVGDVYTAFLQGFRTFLSDAAADPLIVSLRASTAKPDLLRIVTTDSDPIITQASQRLAAVFMDSWLKSSEADYGLLARSIVRLALSYVSMPPKPDHDVAADMARLMTPFIEYYGESDNPN